MHVKDHYSVTNKAIKVTKVMHSLRRHKHTTASPLMLFFETYSSASIHMSWAEARWLDREFCLMMSVWMLSGTDTEAWAPWGGWGWGGVWPTGGAVPVALDRPSVLVVYPEDCDPSDPTDPAGEGVWEGCDGEPAPRCPPHCCPFPPPLSMLPGLLRFCKQNNNNKHG